MFGGFLRPGVVLNAGCSEMSKKTRKRNTSESDYQPTERERTAIDRYRAHISTNLAPRVKVSESDGKFCVSADYRSESVGHVLLMEAIGSMDQDFVNVLLTQIADASIQGRKIDEQGLNFILSVIRGVKPKDQLEAMLAAQMATIHVATMTLVKRLAYAHNTMLQDSAERALNKLARTYVTQMAALKQYRAGAEQKVTMQHVSVSEGGQAVVGNVTQTSIQVTPATPAEPLPTFADARTAPMSMINEPEEHAPVPTVLRSSENDR